VELFDLLESCVAESKKNEFSTDEAVKHLSKELKSLNDDRFCLLLELSGYIPDLYLHDSSEETLYSKFVELLVCEWAQRIGFDESFLPTKKSGTEDIVIMDKNYVIVADAKSFRLSRSQAAPNPKDVIKVDDYKNWIKKYDDKVKLGGLTTFPQLHEWKKSSKVHMDLTNKHNKIVWFYYGHLSAILKFKIDKSKIINFYESYDEMFPQQIAPKDNPKDQYLVKLKNYIFDDHLSEYKEYMNSLYEVNASIKSIAIEKIGEKIDEVQKNIFESINAFEDIDKLKKYVINIQKEDSTREFYRLKKNIEKFR